MPEDAEIELPVVQFESKQARKLADLGGIIRDLGFARDALGRLKELLKENSEDSIVQASLWTAALIAYARCYARGKRLRILDDDVFRTIKGAEEAHRFFRGMRDKHVAHSVNPFEQTLVGVVLSHPGATEKKVEGITYMGISHFTAKLDGVESFERLVHLVLRNVVGMAKEWRSKVLEEARSLPIDDLYRLPRVGITVPGPDAASRPR